MARREREAEKQKIQEVQELTITVETLPNGSERFEISDNTFVSAQLAIFALEAVDNKLMRCIEGNMLETSYKQPPVDGEPMSLKIAYYYKPRTPDRVEILHSTFPFDLMAITVIRLVIDILNAQIRKEMESGIVVPGKSGPKGMH